MTPSDDQLEPWPGYAGASDEERAQLLELKVTDAYSRGDMLYAKALTVAVAACAALDGQSSDLEASARSLSGKIDSAGAKLFGDTGGWTPK